MPRILIIDDEPNVCHVLGAALERGGYDVAICTRANDALGIMRRAHFDLALVDIVMPDKEGLELISEIRREFADVCIVAMSGGGRTAPELYLQIARMFGAAQTLQKPFEPAALLQTVSALLDTR